MSKLSITPGSPEFLLMCLAGYLLLANLLALIAFVIDRSRAESGDRRVPEATFLFICGLGGWFGAALGQALYRPGERGRAFAVTLLLSGMVLPTALAVGAIASDPARAVAGLQAVAARLIAPEPQGPEEVVLGGSAGGTTRLPHAPRRFGPGTDNVPLFHN